MVYTLDLNSLPEIVSTGILTTLDSKIEEKFKSVGKLPETLNRAKGSLMLFYQATGHSETWIDEAYIRSGLNEFYSINESLKHEHKIAGFPGAAFQIQDSSNPLLHLMQLMRHVNVHTQSCPAARHETSVTINVYEPKEWTFTVAIIRDISIDQLLVKREVKRNYDIDQLKETIEWFKRNQYFFGVREVFRRGTEAYCLELLANYIPEV